MCSEAAGAGVEGEEGSEDEAGAWGAPELMRKAAVCSSVSRASSALEPASASSPSSAALPEPDSDAPPPDPLAGWSAAFSLRGATAESSSSPVSEEPRPLEARA